LFCLWKPEVANSVEKLPFVLMGLDIGTGEHPQHGIEMNTFHSAGNFILPATTGGPSVTSASRSSAANAVVLDVAAMALGAS
jgi:hypothetical protein